MEHLMTYIVPGLLFGASAAMYKMPKKFSEIKNINYPLITTLFIVGFAGGILTAPVIQWARHFTIQFVSTSSDFEVTRMQKLIIGAGALVGFLLGLRLGKREA